MERVSFVSYQKLPKFLFDCNLVIEQKVVKRFPKFYQEILTRCGKFLTSTLNVY